MVDNILIKVKALPDEPVYLGIIIFLFVLLLFFMIKKALWKKRTRVIERARAKEVAEGKTAVNEAERKIAQARQKANKELTDLQKRIDEEGIKHQEMMSITARRSSDALQAEEKALAAERRLMTLQNKYKRTKGLLDSAVDSIKRYSEGTLVSTSQINELSAQLASEFDSVTPVNLMALTIKDLRAEFRQNERRIRDICEEYQSRYTSKTNTTIYRLVVLALQEGVQNIYHSLSFGKLENGIALLRTLTSKCFDIAIEGNQTIVSTLSRFIGQVEYLYIESIKIEYEYHVKRERAKEEQRAIREQMRQEAEERRALEIQRKQVENEEKKYHNEIGRLREQMLASSAEELETINMLRNRIAEVEALLAQVEEKKEEIITLQNGKAGTVYIISNLGSFGDKMFKIGMTRRLEPMDRVRELGDASVPFPFDVHSLVFSEDAVALEYSLHKELGQQRVNKINMRKEYFNVDIDQLEELVNRLDPSAPFERTMLAEQYHQSLSIDMPPEETAIDMESDDGTEDILEEEI